MKVRTLALLLLPCALFAQRGDKSQALRFNFALADKLMSEWAVKNHIPGMTYGIVVDGKLVHTDCNGVLTTSGKEAVTTHSEFRIASMTKSFVALSILKLRDQGKLRLDDPAANYIPELNNQRYLHGDGAVITVRYLLTHSAGFPEDNPWGDRQLADTDEDLLKLIRGGISLSNDPGLQYEYSNLGFAMLGYIIKRVSGLSYDRFITEQILRPLGMTHTYFEFSQVPARDLAHGYRWEGGAWAEQPMLHNGIYGAMGGMITTLEDFTKYVAFHQQAWPARDEDDPGPVNRSSVREAQQGWRFSSLNTSFTYPSGRACPVVNAYGYGLRWERDCDGRTFVGHTGGLPGFGSNWRILPDYGIGIICFANATYAPTAVINLQVLDTLLRLSDLRPNPVPVSSVLEERREQLIKLLPSWKVSEDSRIFADNFFLDYSLETLRQEASEAFRAAGRIKSHGPLIAENQLRGAFVLRGEDADIRVWFSLTPEKPAKIQALKVEVVGR